MYSSIVELNTDIDWEKIFFQNFNRNSAYLVLHEGYEIFVYVIADKIYGHLTPKDPFDIFGFRNNRTWIYCGENTKISVYSYIQEFIDKIDESLEIIDIEEPDDF